MPLFGQRHADRIAPHVRGLTGRFTDEGVTLVFSSMSSTKFIAAEKVFGPMIIHSLPLWLEAIAPEQGVPDRAVQIVVAAPVQAQRR